MRPPRQFLDRTPRITGQMTRSSARLNQKRPKNKKTSNQIQVRRRWWKKGDVFEIEYIERAISINLGNKARGWRYDTKWYLYSRSENTRETAYCFAECEHPFLERFWKSVGVPIPAGANEPDAGTVNDPRITHESTQAYRNAEMALNLQSSRNGDDDEEREKETTSMSPDQIDTEAAVNLWPSHNEYNDKEEEKETASMSPEQMEESISDTEEVPSGANPYETTPEPLSVLGTAPPGLTTMLRTSRTLVAVFPQPTDPQSIITYDRWEDAFEGLGINSTVAPLDTIGKNRMFIKPSQRSQGFVNSKSFKVNHLALRSGEGGSSASSSANDSQPNQTISPHGQLTWPHQMRNSTPQQRTRLRMQFYHMEYTKQVNKNLRKLLCQQPPSMELAAWNQPTLPPSIPGQAGSVDMNVNGDVTSEELNSEEELARMITLGDALFEEFINNEEFT